jgi:hypothetical protein
MRGAATQQTIRPQRAARRDFLRPIGETIAIGTLSSTVLTKTPCVASISGTAARLEIDSWFYQPNTHVCSATTPRDRPLPHAGPRARAGLRGRRVRTASGRWGGRVRPDATGRDCRDHAGARRGPRAARRPFPGRELIRLDANGSNSLRAPPAAASCGAAHVRCPAPRLPLVAGVLNTGPPLSEARSQSTRWTHAHADRSRHSCSIKKLGVSF